jgi:hypothetical protein
MNQLIVWRSLLALACLRGACIAILYTAFLPQAAHAGWIRDGIDAYQRATQPTSYPRRDATPLNPIGRTGFGYINDQGGGTDEIGNYRHPVSTRDAFGVDLAPGTYEAPATWDEHLGIRYQVQDGAIVNQQYQFYPQGRR